MRVVLSDDELNLEFSPDLAGILGFDAGVKYSGHEPMSTCRGHVRKSLWVSFTWATRKLLFSGRVT